MRYAPVACVLSLGLCAAAIDAQTLTTDQDKTFYALGIAIGNNIKDFNLTPAELALVTAGLNDASQGKEPKVDFEAASARRFRSWRAPIRDTMLQSSRCNAAKPSMQSCTGLACPERTLATGARNVMRS